nr:MAG TPA: Lower collar protein [Caudoviricetes sp.]
MYATSEAVSEWNEKKIFWWGVAKMATYTTRIRDYIESFTDWKDVNTNTYDKIEKGMPKLFDFTFPWYNDDETSRINFERMFIIHFYMCEIGFETIGLFKLRLNDTLRRNMSKYKAMYDSNLSVAQILENTNMTFDDTDTSDGSNTSQADRTMNDASTSSANDQRINSDNPQVNFSGTDYASGMTRGQSTGEDSRAVSEKNTGKSNTSVVDTSHRTEKGWRGSKMNELIMYREHIVNVNNAIIADCEELFMSIFDDFSEHGNDFNMAAYGNRGNLGLSIDWMR